MPRTGRTTAAQVELGRRIRARRKALAMTQEGLALRSGFSVSWISEVESGTRNLNLMNVLRLSVALRTDVADLVRGLLPDSD